MDKIFRTDLAIEANENIETTRIEGVSFEKEEHEHFTVKRIGICSHHASEELGKPMGKYITIEAMRLRSDASLIYRDVSCAIRDAILDMAELSDDSEVLVAGLGNRRITPDALGPRTADKMLVTRHILNRDPDAFGVRLRRVASFSPSVLGVTGIDTSELITLLTERIKPSLVIAVDALAARSVSRLATTFQISDTGLIPGGGVCRRSGELSRETLGVPVISLGVPTVVDAATLASDVWHYSREKAAENMPKIDANLFVTPNNIDSLIEGASSMIAFGVNMALHPMLSPDEVEALMTD